MTTKAHSKFNLRRSVGLLLLIGVFTGVTVGGSVAAVPVTKVTWRVSSLAAGQVKLLSSVVSTNSPGAKTWSKKGSCSLTPTRKPTKLTMGATGSCVLTLKIGRSRSFAAKSFKKTVTLIAPTTTTVASTTTTVAPATTVAPTTTTTVAPVAAPAFSLSSSSESRVQNVAMTGYVITSTGGVIASYAISPVAPTGTLFDLSTGLLSGTPTTVQDATVYTITATNATGTATRTFMLTVVLPCAAGGACVAGNIGPGGGTVYYVASSNFTSTGSACGTTCRYLEFAPAGWITASTPAGQTNCDGTAGTSSVDPKCVWSGNTSSAIGSTGTGIGTGFANTSAIIAQSNGGNTAGKAATVARAFQGGSKTDWFLPSKDELNALCKWAYDGTVNAVCEHDGAAGELLLTNGRFSWSFYRSSSEVEAETHLAWTQYFGSGFQSPFMAKSEAVYSVRPVRAF